MLPGGIGFSEILVILVVAVLLFGSRLPEVAKNLGKTYQQFRKGLADLQSSIKIDDSDDYRYRRTPTSTTRLAHYKDAGDSETGDGDVPQFLAPPTPAEVQGIAAAETPSAECPPTESQSASPSHTPTSADGTSKAP